MYKRQLKFQIAHAVFKPSLIQKSVHVKRQHYFITFFTTYLFLIFIYIYYIKKKEKKLKTKLKETKKKNNQLLTHVFQITMARLRNFLRPSNRDLYLMRNNF